MVLRMFFTLNGISSKACVRSEEIAAMTYYQNDILNTQVLHIYLKSSQVIDISITESEANTIIEKWTECVS